MKSSFVGKVSAFALLPALAAGLSLGANAQQTSAAQPGKSVAAKQSNQSQASLRQLSASRIIGMSVRGAQGNNIGQIEDLVIDMKTGQVRFAVLEFDPGFFSAERMIPIPVKELRMGLDGNSIVYQNASKEKLQQLSIAGDEWNPGFLRNLDRLGKLEEAWGLPRTVARNTLMRATDVMDKEVQNRVGENIGEIEDLVINMDQQKVHYAVLELERGWLTPDRTIAVPLSVFSNLAGSDDELVMDLTKERAKGMQGLSRDQMRKPADPRVVKIIERHFVYLDPTKNASATASGGANAAKSGTQASGAGAAGGASEPKR